MRIAAEKVIQPKHVAVIGAADDNRSSRPGFEEADAAQDQGAHDPLAELRLRNDQRPQPVRRNDQRFDRLARIGIHQRRSARQLRQFAEECAGALGDNRRLAAGGVALKGLDPASQDDLSPEPTSPALTTASPTANERTEPKRRTRSISDGSRIGNI